MKPASLRHGIATVTYGWLMRRRTLSHPRAAHEMAGERAQRSSNGKRVALGDSRRSASRSLGRSNLSVFRVYNALVNMATKDVARLYIWGAPKWRGSTR